MNTLPNLLCLDLGKLLKKHPLQQQRVKLETTETLKVTPASNRRMSGRLPAQLPITANYLVVPRGQDLQTLADAQVPTLPASEPIVGINRKICVSSANSSPSSGSASVVPVSPAPTVNPVVSPQRTSTLPLFKISCRTSDDTFCGAPSKRSKPHLKLIPKASQRPNSPFKWVIEDEDSSTAPPPVKPSNISDILRVVAERENAKKHSKPVSGLSQNKMGQDQEIHMVMCKEKPFLVAKNGSQPSQLGKSKSPTAARKCCELNKTIIPLSKQSLNSALPQEPPGLRILSAGEVVGPKDEDAYKDSSQQEAFVHMSAVTHQDEDKVFLSCNPPKSDSTQVLTLTTQMAPLNDTDQVGKTNAGFSASATECSKTGNLYQATPGVVADGKDIMKLTVRPHKTQPQTDLTPQKAVTINIGLAPDGMVKRAAMNPSATQQFVRQQIPLLSALSNRVGLYSPNKHPLQQQRVKLETTEALEVTPASSRRMSGRLPAQLPITANYLVVPRGQDLQTLADAQVPTLPASEPIVGINRKICVSPANSSPSSGSASVVPVSPAPTVNPVVSPQRTSTLPWFKILCRTSDDTLCGAPSKRSKLHLKLIPKASQRPNSPFKWVIEDEDSSTAPPPVKPSNISDILQVVAERENAKKHSKPVSGLSQNKTGQDQEIHMVMCKEKPFLVAKNGSQPSQLGKSKSPTAARKCCELNKTIIPLSKQSLNSASPREPPGLRILSAGEVVGPKDEDAYKDSSQQEAFVHMSAVTHQDEDKVFLSCIPPKCDPTQVLTRTTQMAPVKDTDQVGKTSKGLSSSTNECSKTGNLYQATPGVVADGKDIMKLTVRPHKTQPQTDLTPQKAVTINIGPAPDGIVKRAAMNPSATQQFVRQQIPLLNALPNRVGLYSPNKHPLQQQRVKLETTEALEVTPASNRRMSGRLPAQLPITANYLVVPRGQDLQTLADAQVPTLPASEPIVGISRKICVSSANSSPSSGSASVVPVSPAPTVNPVVSPQRTSTLPWFKISYRTSDDILCGAPSKRSKPHIKLFPKASQNSPLKWETENDSSTAPIPEPVKPSNISDILRVVAERENAKMHGDVFSKPVSGFSQVRLIDPPKSESLGGKTASPTREKAGFAVSVNKVKNVVCGSAVMNTYNNEQSTPTQHLENMKVNVETKDLADPIISDSNSGLHSPKEKCTNKMESFMRPTNIWTSSLAPESCQMADSLLRQIFGITADVNICLQRIDGASALSLPVVPLKSEPISPVETHVEPACRMELSCPQETDGCNGLISVKKVKVKIEQGLSEDFTSPNPHTDIGPFKCLHSEKEKNNSGNTSCNVKTEPVTSYMQPIEEDFPSTNYDDTPKPLSQSFVDPNTDTRRMDRKRKRTMCSCCASETGAKSSALSGEPEQWKGMTKQTGKKERRTKPIGKQRKTSERINCPTAKTKHSCKPCGLPASDSLSTSYMICNEEIKRLKELLKEKEAALEMLRNTMS